MNTENYDVIIIGAGAAGMMCAAQAGLRGRKVCLMDHAKKLGEKIRISGGGRCNFTNINAAAEKYLSQNPHFCKSALKQFTQHDFIAMVEKHGIAYHEKTLGQLFCDNKSKDIVNLLLTECREQGVEILLNTTIVNTGTDFFHVFTLKLFVAFHFIFLNIKGRHISNHLLANSLIGRFFNISQFHLLF